MIFQCCGKACKSPLVPSLCHELRYQCSSHIFFVHRVFFFFTVRWKASNAKTFVCFMVLVLISAGLLEDIVLDGLPYWLLEWVFHEPRGTPANWALNPDWAGLELQTDCCLLGKLSFIMPPHKLLVRIQGSTDLCLLPRKHLKKMVTLLLFIIIISSSFQWNNLSDLSAWTNLCVYLFTMKFLLTKDSLNGL